MRYVIADIEATGLGPDRQMIELALITYENGRITDVFETLINPLTIIPKEILLLTEISSRLLENAPKFYEIADRVAMRLEGSVFVSHNVAFDWEMLEKAFTQMGKPLKCKTLCTLKLAQELIPGLKSYNLDELCRFFNIKTINRHRALPDAQAALKLFGELKELASTPRAHQIPRYLPHHKPLMKNLPRHAGVLYLKDSAGTAFHIEAVEDLLAGAERILQVRPEARELLERTESLHFDVTGSELIALFKRARFAPVDWKWMITLDVDKTGEKFFLLKAYDRKSGLWHFQEKDVAERHLRALKKKLPQEKFAWREGGKTKQEILEYNRAVDELVREAQFPCENLLLWGPGREQDEWSYVLVRHGQLMGWGHDKRPPEVVMENPESAIQRRQDKTLEALAIRYLREHRERRFKKEQWRELKELSC
jgi:DNA polymerase-3 subunit epsilon